MKKLSIELKEIITSMKSYLELEKLSTEKETPVFSLFLENNKKSLSKQEKLSQLSSELHSCYNCGLAKTRNNLVFGEGDCFASVVFVGEAPGYEEDLSGQPFVGEAGRLLSKIIESIGLSRNEVYICNVLKCRPPQNRLPSASEILECQKFLFQQLEIIRPHIICCLGKVATTAFLGEEAQITSLRGKEFYWKGIKVIPTFHPAYLLRNPTDKRLVWQDMKKVRQELSERKS